MASLQPSTSNCRPELEGWAVSLPEASASAHETTSVIEPAPKAKAQGAGNEDTPKPTWKVKQDEKKMEKVAKQIEVKEAALEEAETQMNQAYSEETVAKHQKLQGEVEALYAKWEAME